VTSPADAGPDPEVWEPQPPELLPPWHTPERERLQLQARRFAMAEILPVANELDPQKGGLGLWAFQRISQRPPAAAQPARLS